MVEGHQGWRNSKHKKAKRREREAGADGREQEVRREAVCNNKDARLGSEAGR